MTREAGFTLVEVMVALGIFALVGTLCTGLLVTTIDARDRQEAAMERLSGLQQVRTLWREDVAQLVLRPHRTADGGYGGAALAGPQNDFLSELSEAGQLAAFSRRGRANPGGAAGRSSLIRVIWRAEEGNLVREVWTEIDPAPSTAPVPMVLATGLEEVSVQFRYGRNWLNAPPRESNAGDVPMPDAIRLAYRDPQGREIEHIALTRLAGGAS